MRALPLIAMLLSSGPSAAADLVAVPFRAVNDGAEPMVCSASLAHWYLIELGRAAPGWAVGANLWADRTSGTIYILNTNRVPMPVEQVWCGIEGRDASTRSDVPLERKARAVPPAIVLACRDAGGGLLCRPAHAR